MNFIVRLLTFPVLAFYPLVVFVRNKLFDYGIIASQSYEIPVICIGNLSMGGTGKSPHTEYIANLSLETLSKIAILSRGYKRKSKGFIEVNLNHTHLEVGDEPCQFRKKFAPEKVVVAVDSNRRNGIRNLLHLHPDLQLILLDDAFQHRYVKAGLNILLTDYYHPFWKDSILPFGNLREPRKQAARAKALVVTKSPPIVSPIVKREIYQTSKLNASQELMFSKIIYQDWIPFANGGFVREKSYTTIFLFTGIANPYPLELYLKQFCLDIIVFRFSDHHSFTEKELQKVRIAFNNHITPNKALLTTEKDFVRLSGKNNLSIFAGIPAFYVPIQVMFLENDKQIFNKMIIDYVTKN